MAPSFKSVCPLHRALVIFGDRWTLVLIRDLFFRDARYFGDFLNGPEKISSNILASRLQRLEAEGIICRQAEPDTPGRFGYYPTAKALDLIPVLVEMMIWADRYYSDSDGVGEETAQPSVWLETKRRLAEDKPKTLAAIIASLRDKLPSS